MQWKTGAPTTEGRYFVVVIHPKECVVIDGNFSPAPGTTFVAEADIRGFKPTDSGMDWEKEYACETIYAWLDFEDVVFPELPEGVAWKGEPSLRELM